MISHFGTRSSFQIFFFSLSFLIQLSHPIRHLEIKKFASTNSRSSCWKLFQKLFKMQ